MEQTCPRCELPLKPKPIQGRTLAHCPNCGGRSIAVAVVRFLLTPEGFQALWSALDFDDQYESQADCPSCRRRMLLAGVRTDEGAVEIDLCRPCQFLWFDAGELENFPQKPRQPEMQLTDAERHRRYAEARMEVARLSSDHQFTKKVKAVKTALRSLDFFW